MWRSKPSQSQTWQQRLKRVGYIQHLYTRTLNPSLSTTFLEKWMSSVPDSRVSRFPKLEDETQLMIRDIYTHTSLKESPPVDQLTLFSKTSKESSQVKPQTESRYSNMSSETWKKEVISHRGEYSARLKLVRPINEKESLSWPTATVADIRDGQHLRERTKQWMAEGKVKGINLTHATENKECQELYEKRATKNWPTPTATEKSGINPKTGKGEGLSKKAKEQSWPTPTSRDHKDTPGMSFDRKDRKEGRIDCLPRKVYYDGLQDRDKSSTSGKSQESWPTMSMPQGGAALNNKRGKNAGHPLTTAVCMEKKAKTSMRLNPNWVEQVMGLPFVGWTQLPTEWID